MRYVGRLRHAGGSRQLLPHRTIIKHERFQRTFLSPSAISKRLSTFAGPVDDLPTVPTGTSEFLPRPTRRLTLRARLGLKLFLPVSRTQL
ncbi:MAG: hypothetical protein AAF485_26590, partial [Chloroflexota bacterium]